MDRLTEYASHHPWLAALAAAAALAVVVNELRRVMLNLSARTPEGRDILFRINANGFIPPDDHLYDPVRQAYRAMADGGPF